MIKVIATDLDGTILGKDHLLGKEAYETLKQAQEAGIRIIIATGRDYKSTLGVLHGNKLECDYIVSSGAEVRSSDGTLLSNLPMNQKEFPEIMRIMKEEDVFIRFCSYGVDYFIGSEEQAKRELATEARLFFGHNGESDEELLALDAVKNIAQNIQCVDSLEALMQMKVDIYKIFIASRDVAVIKKLDEALSHMNRIAKASSFPNNLELTHINAQKGPVLKRYIEQLGYKMNEVMTIGDSMNDYTMLAMDFGATVAMGDGMEDVKAVAKYVTKTNDEQGAVYAIQQLLERQQS